MKIDSKMEMRALRNWRIWFPTIGDEENKFLIKGVMWNY